MCIRDRYTGCEFFVFAGKAYFRQPPKSAAPVMTLEPKMGIRRATFALRLSLIHI